MTTSTIQGVPVDPTFPALNDVLAFDGAMYAPVVLPAGGGGVTVLANLVNNATETIQSGTPVLIPGMTATVACTAGKTQEVVFDADVYLGAVGSPTEASLLNYFLFVDGVQGAGKEEESRFTDFVLVGLHLSILVTGLSAGNHTFEIRANTNNGSRAAFLNTEGNATTPIRMYIKEF